MIPERRRLPEVNLDNMTLEEFARWILTLDRGFLNKQVWEIEVSYPYKNGDFEVELSPGMTHVSVRQAESS